MTFTKSTLQWAAVCFLVLGSVSARAAISADNQKTLAEAFALFSKGAYPQAIEKVQTIKAYDEETKAEVNLFLGNAEAKLQAFDDAAKYFKAAIANGSHAQSLHYDYGQALFALQKLKDAEQEFRKSIIGKFKMGASAYYIAYIRSVLDDRPGAKDFYSRISKLQHDPDKVKQSSLFQIAEMAKEDADNLKSDRRQRYKRKKLLEGQVEALYRRARDYDPATPVADQARARLEEIEKELEGMVERMRNGNPYPKHMWSLLLSQDFTYDSNVITQADEALIQVSNADALISRTGFVGRAQFNAADTFSFIPELASSISYYSRRSTPSIFQNDNISISPALHTKYEHWSGGKPATMALNFDFNLFLRDYTFAHKFSFFTRSYSSELSEHVKWFATGSTTFRMGLKLTEFYDPSLNAYTPSVGITQLVQVGDTFLVNTLSADYMHARNDFNDERNYRYRVSMAFSHVIEKLDVSPAYSMFVKDTMKQKGSRGNETNIAPSVALNRAFGKNTDGTLEYTWTKNFSKSKDTYQYTKGEAHVGVSYNF